MTEDEIRLALKIQGESDVTRLTKEITATQAEVVKLGKAFGGLGSAAAQNDTAIVAKTQHLTGLNKQLVVAEKQVRDASGGMRNLGQAAYVTSQGLEDLQYGLGGVVNNIPQLVMAFGGGAGLTAVISLTAVAVNQLVKHWDQFVNLVTPGAVSAFTDALGGFQEKLKAIEAKGVKIPVDLDIAEDLKAQIERMGTAKKTVDESLHKPTEDEEKSAKEVARVLNAKPNQERDITERLINAGVAEKEKGPYAAKLEALRAKASEAKTQHAQAVDDDPKGFGAEFFLEELRKAEAKIQNSRSKIRREVKEDPGGVGDTIALAKTGNAAGITMLQERAEKAGSGDLAGQLGGASAEKIAAIEKENRMWDALHKQTLDAGKKDEANKQAARNELERQMEVERENVAVWQEAQDWNKKLLQSQIHALEKLKHEQDAAIHKLASTFDAVFDPRIFQQMFMGARMGKTKEALDESIARSVASAIANGPLAGHIAPNLRMSVARQMVAGQREQFDLQALNQQMMTGVNPFPNAQPRKKLTKADRAAAAKAARDAAAMRRKFPAFARSKALFDRAKATGVPIAQLAKGPGPANADPIQAAMDAAKAQAENTDEMKKLQDGLKEVTDALRNGKLKIQL
jgi:hypothetical protein